MMCNMPGLGTLDVKERLPGSIDDLFESQLGERLEPKYFLKYLKQKY